MTKTDTRYHIYHLYRPIILPRYQPIWIILEPLKSTLLLDFKIQDLIWNSYVAQRTVGNIWIHYSIRTKLLSNDFWTNIIVACPARLYPVCVRLEALQASLRSARRTRGRLTGQSNIIAYPSLSFFQVIHKLLWVSLQFNAYIISLLYNIHLIVFQNTWYIPNDP